MKRTRLLLLLVLLMTAATGAWAQDPTTYKVTIKEGTKDASSWTVNPTTATTTGVKEGTSVTLQYNGRLKVKGVKATSDAAPAEPAYTMAKDATSTDIGKLICTDGHIHAYGEDAECTKDRVAMIAYVGNASDCSHGLAIALQDESGLMDWSTAGTTCSGKTPTVTDGTWRLPSIMDWQYMLIGCGHNGTANANIPTDSYMVATGLFAKLSAAGGDEFLYWIAGVRDANYWMSTENSGNTNQAWRMHFSSKDQAGFHKDTGKDVNNVNVRACLAF